MRHSLNLANIALRKSLSRNTSVHAPLQEIRLPADAAQALLQLVEGRAFDGRLVAGQFHQLASLERHSRQSFRIVLFVPGNADEQVVDDDAEAVDVTGTSRFIQASVLLDLWFFQTSVLLDLWRQVSERRRRLTAVVVAEEIEDALVGADARLVALGSTHDVVQLCVLPVDDLEEEGEEEEKYFNICYCILCVLPVDDLDRPARVHVALKGKKGKGRTLVIAPQVDLPAITEALRYMARTEQRRTYLPLYLPDHSWYSFTDPERMEG